MQCASAGGLRGPSCLFKVLIRVNMCSTQRPQWPINTGFIRGLLLSQTLIINPMMARRAWVGVRADKRKPPVLLSHLGWLIMDSGCDASRNDAQISKSHSSSCYIFIILYVTFWIITPISTRITNTGFKFMSSFCPDADLDDFLFLFLVKIIQCTLFC